MGKVYLSGPISAATEEGVQANKARMRSAEAALQAAGGSWTLYPAEITALDDACFVHQVQLEHRSQGEMADAIALVKRRIAGALAGSPPQGAIVCNPGLLGRPQAAEVAAP